jgi:hypothetical protein
LKKSGALGASIFHIVTTQTISKTRNMMLRIIKYRGKLKTFGALRAPVDVHTVTARK